jgi:type III restriction enzyme
MRRLEYQDRVFNALDSWLDALAEKKIQSDAARRLIEENPSLDIPLPDFAEQAWQLVNSDSTYSKRETGDGETVPNSTLKVPTGGGKTYLAVNAIAKIFDKLVQRQFGLVLWIVPSDAIYTQTIKNLKDKEHPYREVLDKASGYRTKILTRHDPLNRMDVEGNLCVVVLMLPAANREDQSTLKLFQGRGDIHGILPVDGDFEAHKTLIETVSNLDCFEGGLMPQVKVSMGNALKILRPVVVLDEGHKAIAERSMKTVYGFNPSVVLELTATPKPRGNYLPNVLVEITGKELEREGMIKMPLNLETHQQVDWKETLGIALQKLDNLQNEATNLYSNKGRYIRPILLVQVDRTGADQVGRGGVHTDDVIEFLKMQGLSDEEIAVKTASRDDLKNPENQDLLSDKNRVRAIITKQALREGWDCSFAYVLCTLTVNTSQPAMTQLIGRILRQPHAEKTNIAALDQCYVVAHHASTDEVVRKVKTGLENKGLGGMEINGPVDEGDGRRHKKVTRRSGFKETRIFLPQVNFVSEGEVRPLDYEYDILAVLDWRDVDISSAIGIDGIAHVPAAVSKANSINVSDVEGQIDHTEATEIESNLSFNPVHLTRGITDIVLNPFIARQLVAQAEAVLDDNGIDNETRGKLTGHILKILRSAVEHAQDRMAEALFREKVEAGEIQFHLRADRNQYEMPTEFTAFVDSQSPPFHYEGRPAQKSLFEPVYQNDFNDEEHKLAVYLDAHESIKWWHRNVAKTQYGLQGWRRDKIYPDFVFAGNVDDEDKRLYVLEAKGEHLENPDSTYKRSVLRLLSQHFQNSKSTSSGQLELVSPDGTTVNCDLVYFDQIEENIGKLLAV